MTVNPAGKSRGDALLLVATLWVWGCSSAWFWQVAAEHDAMLPYLPRLAWILPGMVGRISPLLVPAILLAGTVFFVWGPGRRLALRRLRPSLIVMLVLTAVIGLIWGRALLIETSATR